MYDDGQLVQQELLTLLGYQSSPQVLVRIVTMGNTSDRGIILTFHYNRILLSCECWSYRMNVFIYYHLAAKIPNSFSQILLLEVY
jgi:hypothetical protein